MTRATSRVAIRIRHGVWVPAFAGTTLSRVAAFIADLNFKQPVFAKTSAAKASAGKPTLCRPYSLRRGGAGLHFSPQG